MPIEIDIKTIWFITGLVLILLEFVAPGIVVIFFGIGAWVVSAGMWMGLIESAPAQCITFTIASLLLLFGLRRYVTKWFVGDSSIGGGDIEDEFYGKSVRVVSAIIGGNERGKVEFKGAEWAACSPVALAVGNTAVITERDGLLLIVKPQINNI